MEVVVTIELSLLKFVIIATFIILTHIVRTTRTCGSVGALPSILEAGQKNCPAIYDGEQEMENARRMAPSQVLLDACTLSER
jgi:hypothetical protein